MAQQIINLGTPPGGTDGDTSRVAFEKTKDNFNELYTRTQGKLTKDVGGPEGTIALTAAEALNGFIDLTGALTGGRVVTVPVGPPQMYLVRNSTTGAFGLTFKASSGSGVLISRGEALLLASDGVSIINPSAGAPGRLLGLRIFTTSGTYVETPGTTNVIVEVQAGGGAGGSPSGPTSSGTFIVGAGGGGGGYVKHRMTSGFSGAAVVVGAGGVPVATTAGGAGGNSSFAGITANGGLGGGVSSGAAPTVQSIPGAGGGASGGNIDNSGGDPGGSTAVITSGNLAAIFGHGGSSKMGGGGTCGNGTNGTSGTGYGGGGSGALTNQAIGSLIGGYGAPGAVLVWEYS